MKLLINIFITLFVLSCATAPKYEYQRMYIGAEGKYSNFVIPNNISLDIYWEWNEIVITGTQLFSKKELTQDSLIKIFEKDSFCSSFIYRSGSSSNEDVVSLGESLKQDSLLNFNCIYSLQNFLKTEPTIPWLLEQILYALSHHRMQVFDKDSVFQVVYLGDSLEIESEQVFNHRATTHVLKFQNPKDQRDTIYETRPVHEFYLQKSDPVYSLSFKTDMMTIKGYKPLKMDPKLLPLESPKYKALKASEIQLPRCPVSCPK